MALSEKILFNIKHHFLKVLKRVIATQFYTNYYIGFSANGIFFFALLSFHFKKELNENQYRVLSDVSKRNEKNSASLFDKAIVPRLCIIEPSSARVITVPDFYQGSTDIHNLMSTVCSPKKLSSYLRL